MRRSWFSAAVFRRPRLLLDSQVAISNSSPWRASPGASAICGRGPQKYQGSKTSMLSSRLPKPGFAPKLDPATHTAPSGIAARRNLG